nr:MAG TPA: hypothetical protein [Caudoviricetes sp.]
MKGEGKLVLRQAVSMAITFCVCVLIFYVTGAW